MSIVQSSQCPLCEQFVPADTKKVKIKNGKVIHEGCAKEIAEAWIRSNMKSDNPRKPQKSKKKNKNENNPNPST